MVRPRYTLALVALLTLVRSAPAVTSSLSSDLTPTSTDDLFASLSATGSASAIDDETATTVDSGSPATAQDTTATSTASSADQTTSAPQLLGECKQRLCGGTAQYWENLDWDKVMTWFNNSVENIYPLHNNIGKSVEDGQASFTVQWGNYIGTACERNSGGWDMNPCAIDDGTSCDPGPNYLRTGRDCILAWRVGKSINRINIFYATTYSLLNGAFSRVLSGAHDTMNNNLNAAYPSQDGMYVKSKTSGLRSLVSGASAFIRNQWADARAAMEDLSRTSADITQSQAWLSQAAKVSGLSTAKGILSKASAVVAGLSIAYDLLAPVEPAIIPGAGQSSAMLNYWKTIDDSLGNGWDTLMKDNPYVDNGLYGELASGRWIQKPKNQPSYTTLSQSYFEVVVARYLMLLWKRYSIWFEWSEGTEMEDCRGQDDYTMARFCWLAPDGVTWRYVKMVNTGGNALTAPEVDAWWRYVKAYQFDNTMASIGITKFNLAYVFEKSLQCHRYMTVGDDTFADDTNPGSIPLPWATRYDTFSWMLNEPKGGKAIEWLENNIYRDADMSDWNGLDSDKLMCLFSVPIVPVPKFEGQKMYYGKRRLSKEHEDADRNVTDATLTLSEVGRPALAKRGGFAINEKWESRYSRYGLMQGVYADNVIKYLIDSAGANTFEGPWCGDVDFYRRVPLATNILGTTGDLYSNICGSFYRNTDPNFYGDRADPNTPYLETDEGQQMSDFYDWMQSEDDESDGDGTA